MRRRTALALMAATVAVRPASASSGRRVPAEDAPHARTFMQWPVNRRVHPDTRFLAHLQDTIARIAGTIAEFEPVVMLMDRRFEDVAALPRAVDVWNIPTDDLWARDSGPLFAKGLDGLSVVSLNFDGWGGKQVHGHDRPVAARVAQRMGLPLVDSGLSGEAGGVEQDGAGLLLAHESSWVEAGRNPGLTRAVIEKRLLQAYGADRMIWAPGIQGEDITDDHIDPTARFVEPGHVLIQLPSQRDRDRWARSQWRTHDILRDAGLRLTILPEPERLRVRSDDFLASYANFYVCNGAFIAPSYGDTVRDAEAAEILAEVFPGRDIVQIDADALGEVGGGIHCATQQQPV